MNKFIPTLPELTREVLIVLVGLIGAAFVLSRFPALRDFVTGNSLTVKDESGKVLF
jgi:hypothetical protein